MLINCAVNFVEIAKVCARKAIAKAAKRITNSDRMCRSYSDLNFGVTFLEHSVYESNAKRDSSRTITLATVPMMKLEFTYLQTIVSTT